MPGDSSGALATGLRFGLTDSAFDSWWRNALLPEDQSEFVHIYNGNKLGARFVCALDYLSRVDNRNTTPDVIVEAYMLAKKLDAGAASDILVRQNAQYVYEDPSVKVLLDRIRYRTRAIAMERVAAKTYAKVEELYSRADVEADPDAKLAIEKVAINAGTTLLSIDERQRTADAKRRDAKAFREAMETSRQNQRDASQAPTLDEAKHFILMLKEQFGPEAIAQMFQEALPPVPPEVIDADDSDTSH